MLYRRDSWIDSWNSSEEGQKFLKALWRLQQTEAIDKDKIKDFKGIKGVEK